MNITLSADSDLVRKARKYAQDHDTSLNKMVRKFLQSVVDQPHSKNDVDYFLNSVERIQGNSKGNKWNREELYDI
ncbi:MAG: hypothetical protein ISR82_08375 [Candidatus Marinimicrobia bacterium]|nr:hypothetical protein [Candidatus Neomarinimicrobiota bacterium]MBL7011222.1 hypothetical protein [Candidatus Neomarinimicrobiota bacterium]MBL7031355.1 hypothetical protein [Candidatus Neomarinimicrobiota bacterium]